jgi:alanine racemase
MDMTMVDVTDVPCEVGDVATLIGRDGDDVLTVDEVAATAQILSYELLVGLKLRVPRIYVSGTATDVIASAESALAAPE